MEPLNHQREALAEIVARARAYYAGRWHGLDLQCRWHSLMAGGTGNGKSTLAYLAARACDATPIRIATAGYIPCGAHNRGARETIAVLAEEVAKNQRTFVILDELCKLTAGVGGGSTGGGGGGGGGGSDTWQTYVRGELLDLTDGRWPTGLNIPELDGLDITIDELTTKLKTTVFVLGIGTFQSALDDASRRTIGFPGVTDDAGTVEAIGNDTVVGYLGRELGNRFHSQLIRLPELRADDYHRLAREAESKLPERMREPFRAEIAKRITEAIANKKSVRFLEEALTATIMKLPTPVTSNHLSLNNL